MAHDKLGMCMTSLVVPKQSVLSILGQDLWSHSMMGCKGITWAVQTQVQMQKAWCHDLVSAMQSKAPMQVNKAIQT